MVAKTATGALRSGAGVGASTDGMRGLARDEARGTERISSRCSKIKEEKHFQEMIQNSEVRILP